MNLSSNRPPFFGTRSPRESSERKPAAVFTTGRPDCRVLRGHRARNDEPRGVTASGAHLMAIRTLLLNQLPTRDAVIVGAGWGDVRFHVPVHPGDELWLEATWLTKRRSASKRDRGIVTALMKLVNQSAVVVVSHE